MRKIFTYPRLHILTACFIFLLVTIVWQECLSQNRTIAVFGSSVANGSGDTTTTGGYAGMIKALLEKRGYMVVNVSRGGDNTAKILSRFETDLLPENPRYVIIGLSLGNEGIASESALTRNRVFERFRSGMLKIVKLCREHGMQPVIVNCYTRNDFGPEQYEAVQKMNMLLDTWDVPVINALGAIDDGSGHWAEGYWHDRSHPNIFGHREIFYAFVPSLFDALESGKATPEKVRTKSFLSIPRGQGGKPLVFDPAGDSIHSFTVSFCVKTRNDGTVATIRGQKSAFTVAFQNGKVILRQNGKDLFFADTTVENKGWQYVVVSYRQAIETLAFYVNANLAGSQKALHEFSGFILGGSGSEIEQAPENTGYRDLLIYRSAMNSSEIQAIYYDQLLPTSLEIYAPLNDSEFKVGNAAANYAQSLSKLMINAENLVPATEKEVPKSK